MTNPGEILHSKLPVTQSNYLKRLKLQLKTNCHPFNAFVEFFSHMGFFFNQQTAM